MILIDLTISFVITTTGYTPQQWEYFRVNYSFKTSVNEAILKLTWVLQLIGTSGHIYFNDKEKSQTFSNRSILIKSDSMFQ